MPKPNDLTALLLAGGQSRRFGRDKARARVGSQTMLQHVYCVVQAVTPHVLLSIRADGDAYLDLLPEAIPRLPDPLPHAGPLAGLVAGLRAATTSWLLAVACDLPGLTPETLSCLLKARTAQANAVVPITPDGQRHPLCALYHVPSVQPIAEAHLAAGCLALHALLERLHVMTVPLAPFALHNINTPADLAAFRRNWPLAH